MSSDSPTLEEEVYARFLRGDWAALGITGERETALCARMRRYVDSGRSIPSHLLYWAREVWEVHRDQILEDAAWEEADRGRTECRTCPVCACPGSE